MKQLAHLIFALGLLPSSVALADWQPTRPVEFVVTAGAGGGTDLFARAVQAAIQKNNLMSQPIIVTTKGGGSGAEGYVYGKGAEGDAHKLIFGTHNMYALPLGAKMAFTHRDLTPVAAMVFDEFLIWVNGDSPVKDSKEFAEAVKAKGGLWKMAGSQSKDSDELLTKLLEKAIGSKMIYVPFKSGGEADVQLSGGHVESHVNNPAESIGNWKAGKVRPLCVFNKATLPAGPKVTETQAWSDIPTCTSQGIGIEQFQQPRIASLPGKVSPDAVAFYEGLLKKVAETAEWKDYVANTGQTGRVLTGRDLTKFIDEDYARFQAVFKEQGWLVQ
jgi:tripartite-type tricarboxylate transporter receptor subunit TctC